MTYLTKFNTTSLINPLLGHWSTLSMAHPAITTASRIPLEGLVTSTRRFRLMMDLTLKSWAHCHEIVFKRIIHRVKFLKRVAFWRHPPSFFSSDFGHVTPPLSCACHVTVRWCCRRSGGFACLCHGWGWGIWTVSGLLLGRLSGTTCYRGLQSWWSTWCLLYPIWWPTGDESFWRSLSLCLRARSVSPM